MADYIVPLAGSLWEKFLSFYAIRDPEGPAPLVQGDGLAYVRETRNGPVLIAGVCLYPCSPGPFLMVEHFATDPFINPRHITSARLVHHAALRLLEAVTVVAAARKQYPVILVRHPSIRAVLRRAGYHQEPAGHWTVYPSVPVGNPPQKRKEAPPRPAPRGRKRIP